MARRNNKKLANARHEAMLADERDRLAKKKSRAARRARKEARAKVESVLCSAFNSGFTFGNEASRSAPKLGAPVTTEIGKDIKMKPVSRISKRGKVKKSKKSARRSQKIRQRQAERSAMVM